jgi:hypothetical protein
MGHGTIGPHDICQNTGVFVAFSIPALQRFVEKFRVVPRENLNKNMKGK